MVATVLNRLSDGEFEVSNELLATIGATMSDDVTREALATMLYTYAQFAELDMTQNTNILSYSDALEISDFAFEPLQWTCENGIINGTDLNKLEPQGIATRSEVVAVMILLLVLCR